jgi:predicted RNase H-like nuclease (RuvC/YqgF family)
MSYHVYMQEIKDLEEELLEKDKTIDKLKAENEKLKHRNDYLRRYSGELMEIAKAWKNAYDELKNKYEPEIFVGQKSKNT